MKTESILNREEYNILNKEEYNKEHEEIIKSLDEIVSSLSRIEDKLSKMLGENHRRLNEGLNKGYLTYNALCEPIYRSYDESESKLTNKIDLGALKDEK